VKVIRSARNFGVFLVVVGLCATGWLNPRPLRAGPGKKPPLRVDAQGDPLPTAALRRLGSVRLRHNGWVTSCATAPGEGKGVLVTACPAERAVVVRSLADGRQLRRIEGESGFWSVAVSADGKTLAAVDESRATVWNFATGKRLRQFDSRATNLNAGSPGHIVSLSADGSLLAMFGRDGVPQLWDVATGKRHCVVSVPVGGDCLALSADGKQLAVGGSSALVGNDRTVYGSAVVVDTATGKVAHSYPGCAYSGVQDIALSPDGKLLLHVNYNGLPQRRPYLREVPTGREVRILSEAYDGCCVAFSRDNLLISVGCEDGKVALFDARSGGLKLRCKVGTKGRLDAITFSADGKTLVGVGKNHALHLWDVTTGEEKPLAPGHASPVAQIAFGPDGRSLVSHGLDGIRVWSTQDGKLQRHVAVGVQSEYVTLSPDGKKVVAPDDVPVPVLFDVDSGTRLWAFPTSFEYHLPPPLAVFATDSARLIATQQKRPPGYPSFEQVYQQRLAFLDVATGKEGKARPLVGDRVGFSQLALSPDGKLLAGALRFGKGVRLWDAVTGTDLRTFAETPAVERALEGRGRRLLAFAAGGKLIAVAETIDTSGGALSLWETTTGKEVARWDVGKVHALAVTRDGKTLAAAETDGTIRLWDVATRKERGSFRGHSGPVPVGATDPKSRLRPVTGVVTALAFSPDGRILASGGADTTILLWDVAKVTPPAKKPR
jgi:WD40 repeat protein